MSTIDNPEYPESEDEYEEASKGMSNPKEEIEKLKEGCMCELFQMDSWVCCGHTCADGNKIYCNICQAKLETWKVALTSEINWLEGIHDVRGIWKIIEDRLAELKGVFENEK